MLFSVGLFKPLWEYLFPDCFGGGHGSENNDDNNDNNSSCSPELLASLTYSVVLGVMTGMILVGYLANHIGRRRGSILTASIMAGGAWGLTLTSMTSLFVLNSNNNSSHVVLLFRTLAALFFLFGVGVGGEYPLSASSASERAMQELQARQQAAMKQLLDQQQQQNDQDPKSYYMEMYDTTEASNQKKSTPKRRPKAPPQNDTSNATTMAATTAHGQRYRGRNIQLVFSMQGMGILFNSITMTALLLLTGQGEIIDDDQVPEYSSQALASIWIFTYAIAALLLTYVLVSRYRHLTESPVWDQDKKQREQVERHQLLEAVVSTKRAQEKQELQEAPSLEYNISNVSSLSAPSVTVDYHNQAIMTSGLTTSPPSQQHHHHHHSTPTNSNSHSSDHGAVDAYQTLQPALSTDPEDDLKASPNRLFLRNYGLRLVGASLSWLLWDIAFYGNKLFQSTFLLALTGESTTLLEFSMAASLNSFVALLGYFGAAMLVDTVGRRNLQQYGFLITGGLFVTCGFLYFQLSTTTLVALYLGSSFFGQLGPNATTFLIPAEIFPTEMRTMAHGICAASGKAGALIAVIIFNATDDTLDLFLLSGYASFAACLITFCTIPETLGLDLFEVDKKWRMILEGRKGDYKGDANHPRFLSYYERAKLASHNMTDHHVDIH